MAGNTFGKIFKLTTFGESHGKAIGGIIDGCPAGLEIDFDFIRDELDRRKPGQSALTTQRKESDNVEFLSGIFEGKTTGTPIAFLIWNEDRDSKDYDHLKEVYRPSHADFTFEQKYGVRDHRGGGRSSARETAARVAGGAFAKLLLQREAIKITAFVSQIGNVILNKDYKYFDIKTIESSPVRCPDKDTSDRMVKLIEKVKSEGDTIGGVISCFIQGVPAGLGEPVFDKLQADLAKAMLSINAAKGFEYGSGFRAAQMKGSEHNDLFEKAGDKIVTKTNYSGGIQGGISNGQDIYFRVAFKPVATLMMDQETVNKKGEKVILKGRGRHDVCVVPRAVPIVEAMAALVMADFYLRNEIKI
ncbi:MAG: chorismate synthase [Bacteroidetes bacterium]|nr:chorismate synthase [Bacteroidota bacterium]MBL7105193.1 chorismate synthase [Bacteroidales bacterium]